MKEFVSAVDHQKVEPELNDGGAMRKLCQKDEESQLSIFDVHVFLRYLGALKGNGSQMERIQKVVKFGQKVSAIEGVFLLKLIEKRLTIGAGSKTFNKADLDPEREEEKQEIEEEKVKIPRKKR